MNDEDILACLHREPTLDKHSSVICEYMAKILIAEDERIVAWNIREILSLLGHDIVGSVVTAEEAIEIAEIEQPDLVVMDIRLNGAIDGIGAAQEIYAKFNIPSIYLTAYADDLTIERAMQTAPFGYVLKPFKRSDLLLAIQVALNRYQQEKTVQQTHRQLVATLNSIADGAIATDGQGTVTFMNPAAETLTGWSFPEAIGQSVEEILDLTHQETGQTIPNPLLIAMSNNQRVDLPNFCNLRMKDGTERIVGDSAAPIQDDHHDVIGGVMILQDATDQYQATQTLRQQAQHERLLNAIAHHIRQSFDLDKILQAAVEEIHHTLACDRVIIFKLDSTLASGHVIAEALSEGIQSTLGETIRDSCFARVFSIEKYRQGFIHQIDDLDQSDVSTCYQEMLNRLGVRSHLVVPIVHETTLWGLLAVQHCRTSRHWLDWEAQSLKQLSVQLCIALRQAELYQNVQSINVALEKKVEQRTDELKRALRYEELLRRITQKIRETLDEHHIIQAVVDDASAQLNALFGNAIFYEQPEGEASPSVVATFGDRRPDLAHFVLDPSTRTAIHRHRWAYRSVHCCIAIQASDANRPQPDRTNDKANDEAIHAVPTATNSQDQSGSSPGSEAGVPDKLPSGEPIASEPIAKEWITGLLCPMVDEQGVVLGDIFMAREPHCPFEEAEIRLLQQVADQCAIAIRQAQLYQAAQTQVQELKQFNQLKDNFLSAVSHELRTPIASIRMATQMLEVVLNPLGLLDPESGRIAQYFDILKRECQKEADLIDNLLDLTRFDAEPTAFAYYTVNLPDFVADVVKPFADQINKKQQVLTLDIPDDLPPLLTAPSYLKRIMTELMENACKCAPPGEGVQIAIRATSEEIEIAVSNAGAEISSEELSTLLDLFSHAPTQSSSKYSGTGLGLALAKRQVEQLRGRLSAQRDGQWMTLKVYLPRNPEI